MSFKARPESVQAAIVTPNVDVCPSKVNPTVMFCDVPRNTLKATPVVELRGMSDGILQAVSEVADTEKFRFKFMLYPQTAGIYRVTCVASNNRIPMTIVEDSLTFVVQGRSYIKLYENRLFFFDYIFNLVIN